ncbi:MAG: multiubiquitin domain-containing protein [Candidatus Moraniibacteriota bacterium]
MKQEKETVIHIDNKPYKTSKGSMTGAEIRFLPEPNIGSDRDLFLVVPGPQDDRKIGDDESVELHNGMHFYSAPTNINPGK